MKFAKRKAPGAGEFAAYEFDLQRSLGVSFDMGNGKSDFVILNVSSTGSVGANSVTYPATQVYSDFGESFRTLDSWSAYMITSYEDAERYFGRKADKNRKIYNGMLKTYFYQFMGPRPPKAKK